MAELIIMHCTVEGTKVSRQPLGVAPVSNIADFNDLDSFTQGYIEAMFFTECNCDNPELEHAETGDFAPDTLAGIQLDCETFQKEHAVILGITYSQYDYDESQAGRDYWFTRNGHGVGFWDRDLGKFGESLTHSCQYNEINLYKGDDGLLYLS